MSIGGNAGSHLSTRQSVLRLFNRFFDGELRLTRIEAFSDAVFAVIVTLLVLEPKVPALKDHASVGELAHQLLELMPKFLAWLIKPELADAQDPYALPKGLISPASYLLGAAAAAQRSR